MFDKKAGRIFWEEKDGNKRLMIEWQAKKRKTSEPWKDQQTFLLMKQMNVSETKVEIEFLRGRPQNVDFIDKESIAEVERQVEEIKRKQNQNVKKSERDFSSSDEKHSQLPEKQIDRNYSIDFHNPYNFVPAIPRESITGELADRNPTGHDRFHPEKYTGKLTVKMTAETPLVILDTAKVEIDNNEHKKFPVRMENGKPYINPTALRGMLRSAYEIVTNSRMSVIDNKHKERLAFRAEVGEGIYSIPARIEGEKGKEEIVLFTGKSEIDEGDGGPKITGYKKNGQPIRQSQFGAWLETYKKKGFRNRNGKKVFAYSYCAVKPEDGNYPKHGKKAWAWIEFDDSKKYRFTFYKVRKLSYEEKELGNAPNTECEKVEGYICNTGKNIGNKHDERFFFNPTEGIKLEPKHVDSWNILLKNYRKQHETDFDSPPKDKFRRSGQPDVEYSLEWSRHIQRTTKQEISENVPLKSERLKDGTLCYARVKRNGSSWEILELYPVMISRRLHTNSPVDLLDDSLKPAMSAEELSPADRVFGWVNQKGEGAYRGQIRVGSVECKTDDPIQEFEDLPLNILGRPKPQQGRFYVAENERGDAQTHCRTNEDAGYKKEHKGVKRGLRGRKVYPHHRHIEGDEFWFEDKNITFKKNEDQWKEEFPKSNDNSNPSGKKYFREFLRPRKDNQQQRNKQNRSIKGWVKPKTEFTFDIHFTNLSKVELGALIWLLDMNEFANADGENKEFFHRFGGGKPYGFGSVRLSLEGAEISSGEDLKKFYSSLDKNLSQSIKSKDCISAFNTAIKESGYGKLLEAFKVACKGFEDNLPIHYPRKRREPNADGKSFEWFVANNKRDGRKLSLPNLSNEPDEVGLPLRPQN